MNRLLTALLILAGTTSTARADIFYPMVMAVSPVAVQAGQTTECEFTSVHSLHGAYQVMVTGTGVAGEVEPPPKPPEKPAAAKPVQTQLKVRFKVAADA